MSLSEALLLLSSHDGNKLSYSVESEMLVREMSVMTLELGAEVELDD